MLPRLFFKFPFKKKFVRSNTVFLQPHEIATSYLNLVPQIPKYPIALIHGMGGDKPFLRYFRTIPEDFETLGIQFIQPLTYRYATCEKRAILLKQELDEYFVLNPDVKKLNLIGHSMGGLDARFLISSLGGHEKIASLTTIGTPHHGSSYCDWCVRYALQFQIDKFLKLFPWESGAWHNLITEYLIEFNEKNVNHPAVSYYSIAGDPVQMSRTNILYLFWRYTLEAEGPNDGLVSVNSAKWGKFLGTVPLDHAQQIGWSFIDHRYMFRKLVNVIAEEGH
jgi:triacylglycerol esterase/lipase EstA (alpha/beta hydrolase family)